MKNIYFITLIAFYFLSLLVITLIAQDLQNLSTDLSLNDSFNSSINDSINNSINYTLETPSESAATSVGVSITKTNQSLTTKPSVEIISLIPSVYKVGDAQLNIKVINNENFTKTNLIALVTANGFSTYNIIPIESISPGEKDYIFINGNFKESGTINLTIYIDNNIFYRSVIVNPEISKEVEEKIKLEEENKALLANLSIELSNLKENYSLLETDFYNKKDQSYDVSKVSLSDLKSYIKTIDSDILNEDIKDAKAKLKLATDEYVYQKNKLDSATKISTLSRLKDNAVVFSAIAGAILTFFALSEILKRKSENFRVKINQKKIDDKNNKKKKSK